MIEIAPKSDIYMTYDNALLYCQFLEYNGYKDWRLPTHKEWWDSRISTNSWWQDREHNDECDWLVQPVRDM